MKARKIKDRIYWMGSVDWDRRLFDSLVPLPDGTSYNAYLIKGSEKTVLIDTVDLPMADELMGQLEGVTKLDYIISHHAEQDHSGTIPQVLEKYPDAKLISTPKAKGMLIDLLQIPEEFFITVEDGETLSLGDKTLKFIHTPWVHWPETMVTWLEEDKILFSCDFFGSHIATTDLYVTDEGHIYEAAKRYFAEIMMPFRDIIAKNLEKLAPYDIEMIAPSHGQIFPRPAFIIDAYRDWILGPPRNTVVLPYVSMHESTKKMVDYLVSALVERGVRVEQFNLEVTDIGKLAMALVDAATIVIGTPTVLAGPHPYAAYAAFLANALRPKAKFLSIIGSYGWGGKTVETLAGMIPNLKVEVIDPVLCKGVPSEGDFKALDELAAAIAEKHKEHLVDFIGGDEPDLMKPKPVIPQIIVTTPIPRTGEQFMNKGALHKISYGMYILTSGKDNKFNGQIVNSVIQATSEPATVAVCVNHDNLTHEFIENSKVFTLSILSEDAPMSLIGNFGFKSGRDIDKFKGVNFRTGQNGAPIILDSVAAFLECELIKQMDIGSHTMFLGRVIDGDILSDKNPMTYAYYHTIKGGKAPKSAPHYIGAEEGISAREKGGNKVDKYVCTICGYVYDPEKGDSDGGISAGTPFEDLPDDWTCPICGAAKEEFEKE